MSELISVIVPIYNSEETLERCINSLVLQTYSNLEIILVNDGSTDNSYQICKKYSDKFNNIKFINKDNGGVSEARNLGLKYAKGEYIGFVDSDDWVSIDMYEILHKYIVQEGADIACGEIIKTSHYKKEVLKKNIEVKVYGRNEYSKKYFKIKNTETVYYVVNKLYKKEIAKKIVFPEKITIAEDVVGFYYALVNSNKIIEINREIYFYWDNPKSSTSTWFSIKHLGIIESWKLVLDDVKIRRTEWIKFATFNYYRAYFGVLCRLMLEGSNNNYKLEEEYLRNKINVYFKYLLLSPMQISRKIMLIAIRFNYQTTKKMVHLYVKVLKNGLSIK